MKNFYGETMGRMLDRRRLDIKDVDIEVFGDTAIAVFEWEFHAVLRESGSPLVTHGRETQVLRRRDGAWRTVHVHYSGMPVTAAERGF